MSSFNRRTKRGRLRARAETETNVVKDDIQAVARQIVIIRDGGCILRDVYGVSNCDGRRNDGELVLQADHLITRGNAATYSDTRLLVCVCRGHHGWKKYYEKEYNTVVRTLLSPERLELWDRAYAHRFQPHRKYTYDWRLDLAALKQELRELCTAKGVPYPYAGV